MGWAWDWVDIRSGVFWVRERAHGLLTSLSLLFSAFFFSAHNDRSPPRLAHDHITLISRENTGCRALGSPPRNLYLGDTLFFFVCLLHLLVPWFDNELVASYYERGALHAQNGWGGKDLCLELPLRFISLLPRSRCRVSRVLCASGRAPVARQLDSGRVNCRSAWHGKIGAGKYICDLESTWVFPFSL
jgi:hypothetical protein